MATAGGSSNVQVTVRIRPLDNKDEPVTTAVSGSTVLLSPVRPHHSGATVPFEFARGRDVSFTFDRIFNGAGGGTNQSDVNHMEGAIFEAVGRPCSQLAFQGINSCIFAFGHTGSGKTYTMFGKSSPAPSSTSSSSSSTVVLAGEVRGIAPRMIDDIFSTIAARSQQQQESAMPSTPIPSGRFITKQQQSSTTLVSIRIIEIYNEEVACLLSRPTKRCLVRESRDGPFVDGAIFSTVHDAIQANALIQDALALRKVSATSQNARSTRSHVVLTIKTVLKFFDPIDDKISLFTSHMNLVDLAGSEKIGKNAAAAAASSSSILPPAAGAMNAGYLRYGASFEEGININKSLLTLGVVIECLTQQHSAPPPPPPPSSGHPQPQQQQHHYPLVPPYRDSKLTFLIKDALGGDSVTHMIATITPSQDCFFESYNTLQYADRAKKIRNHAIEHKVSDAHSKILEQQKSEIDLLRTQLRETCDLLTQQRVGFGDRRLTGIGGLSLGDLFTPPRRGDPAADSNNAENSANDATLPFSLNMGDVVVPSEVQGFGIPRAYLLLMKPCPIAESTFVAFLLPTGTGTERQIVTSSSAENSSLATTSAVIPFCLPRSGPQEPAIHLASIVTESPEGASTAAHDSQLPISSYVMPRYSLVTKVPATSVAAASSSQQSGLRVEIDGIVVKNMGEPAPIRVNASIILHYGGSMMAMRLVRTRSSGDDHSSALLSSPFQGPRAEVLNSPFARLSQKPLLSASSPLQEKSNGLVVGNGQQPLALRSPLSGRRQPSAVRSVVVITPSRYGDESHFSADEGRSDRLLTSPSRLLALSEGEISNNNSNAAGPALLAMRIRSVLPPYGEDSIPSRSEAMAEIALLQSISATAAAAGVGQKGEALMCIARKLVIYRGQWLLFYYSSNGCVRAFIDTLRFTSCGMPILPSFDHVSGNADEDADDVEEEVNRELVESCVAVLEARHERISVIVAKQFDDNDRADLPTDVSEMVMKQSCFVGPTQISGEQKGPLVCRRGLEQFACLFPTTYALGTASAESSPSVLLHTLDWNGNTTLSVIPCAAPMDYPQQLQPQDPDREKMHDSNQQQLVVVEHEDVDLLKDVVVMNCALYKREASRRRLLRVTDLDDDDDDNSSSLARVPKAEWQDNSSGRGYNAQMMFLGRQAQQRTVLALIAASDEKQALHDAVVEDLNTRIRFLLEDHSIMHFQLDRAELLASERLKTIQLLEAALAERDDAMRVKKGELEAAVDLLDIKERQLQELKQSLAAVSIATSSGIAVERTAAAATRATTPPATPPRPSPSSKRGTEQQQQPPSSSPSRPSRHPSSSSLDYDAMKQKIASLVEELDSRNRSVLSVQQRFFKTKEELEESKRDLSLANETVELLKSELGVLEKTSAERQENMERIVERLRLELRSKTDELDAVKKSVSSSSSMAGKEEQKKFSERQQMTTVIEKASELPGPIQQQQQVFLTRKELSACRKDLEQMKLLCARKDATIVQLQAEVRQLKTQAQ